MWDSLDLSKIEVSSIKEEEKKFYFWIRLYDDGINETGVIIGKDLKDAIARKLIEDKNEVMLYSLDDILENIKYKDEVKINDRENEKTYEDFNSNEELFNYVTDEIIRLADESYIDGDSRCRIEIVNITDRSYPELL